MIDLTLNSLLKQECANYSGDKCLGVNPEGIRFNINGKCYILKDRKPCRYFEKCVIGFAKYLGCYDKVLKEYKNINLSFGMKEKVRHCECGKELLKRERFCAKCKKKKNLESKRKYWKNNKGSD